MGLVLVQTRAMIHIVSEIIHKCKINKYSTIVRFVLHVNITSILIIAAQVDTHFKRSSLCR